MNAAKKLLNRLSGAQGHRDRDEFLSGDREPFLPLRQRSVTVPGELNHSQGPYYSVLQHLEDDSH